MIFLAVSLLLFVSAWGLVGGRQQRVQFSEGMQEIQTKIQTIIGEVNNGYFQNADDLQCLTEPSGTVIRNGGASISPRGIDIPHPQNRPYVDKNASGINKSTGSYQAYCIFFGKAIQFGDGTTDDQFTIHTLLANSLFTESLVNGGQTLRADTLRPDYLDRQLVLPTAMPDFRSTYASPWGIKYKYGSVANKSQYNTIVFIGGFGLSTIDPVKQCDETKATCEGGAQIVTPVVLDASSTRNASAHAVELLLDDPHSYITTAATPDIKPFRDVMMCFTDETRTAAILFAQNSAGQLTTELQFNPSGC